MPRAPSADDTRTRLMTHVVGNKGDTAVTTAGSTASIIAYLKGLVGALIPPLTNRVQCAQTALLDNTPNGDHTLFTMTGSIKVLAIIGIVKTTAMAAAQTRLKLTAVSDSLTGVDLCTALDVTGKTAGVTLNITGTLANAMVAAANGVAIAQAGAIVIPCITSSIIKLNNADAANAGRTFWQLLYEPLCPTVTVTASDGDTSA